jgi:hypothetical protein
VQEIELDFIGVIFRLLLQARLSHHAVVAA